MTSHARHTTATVNACLCRRNAPAMPEWPSRTSGHAA
jgi:hypothetical protein